MVFWTSAQFQNAVQKPWTPLNLTHVACVFAGNEIQDDRSYTLQPQLYPMPQSAAGWEYSTVWDASVNVLSLLLTIHDPGSYAITLKMAYEDFAPMAFTVVPGPLSVAASEVTGAGTRFGEDNAWSSLRIVPRDGSAAANALLPSTLDAAKFSLLSTPAVADTTAGGATVCLCLLLISQAQSLAFDCCA